MFFFYGSDLQTVQNYSHVSTSEPSVVVVPICLRVVWMGMCRVQKYSVFKFVTYVFQIRTDVSDVSVISD
jgi:hypothetical protein